MRRKPQQSQFRASTLSTLRGANGVPEDLARRHLAENKRRLEVRRKQTRVIGEQLANYRRRLRDPALTEVGDADGARIADELRAMGERLTRQAMADLASVRQIAGTLAGSYSAKITPPYDYAYAELRFPTTGRVQVTASANQNTGQLSCSMVTSSSPPAKTDPYDISGLPYTPNVATRHAEVGLYFRPMFGPAILRVSAAPAFAFSWWANSISADMAAVTRATGALAVWKPTGDLLEPVDLAEDDFVSWDVTATEQVNFDVESNPGGLASVQLQVDPSNFYIVCVTCDCHVEGAGWPGSLAGANLSITVPFITLALTPILVANAGSLA
jgi:hypothetical protein